MTFLRWLLVCCGLVFLTATAGVSQEPAADFSVNKEGWRYEPEVLEAAIKRVPRKFYAQAAILAEDSDERTVLLYRFVVQARGLPAGTTLPTRDQGNVGSCVGYATANAVDHLSAVQIYLKGLRERFEAASAPALYGIGRQQAGQLGGWDGSTGAWSVEGIQQLGALWQLSYGEADLSRERPSDAKNFASRGLPASLLEIARETPVQAHVAVRDWKHARGLIQSGFPLIVCSDVGFDNGSRGTQRDNLGFASPRGSWMHAMCCVAYRGPDTGREGFLILNSWNPRYISGEKWPEDQPEGSFWVTPEVLGRMISKRDTWGISALKGFPKKELTLLEIFENAGGARTEN
jgi:hypothetical protein